MMMNSGDIRTVFVSSNFKERWRSGIVTILRARVRGFDPRSCHSQVVLMTENQSQSWIA